MKMKISIILLLFLLPMFSLLIVNNSQASLQLQTKFEDTFTYENENKVDTIKNVSHSNYKNEVASVNFDGIDSYNQSQNVNLSSDWNHHYKGVYSFTDNIPNEKFIPFTETYNGNDESYIVGELCGHSNVLMSNWYGSSDWEKIELPIESNSYNISFWIYLSLSNGLYISSYESSTKLWELYIEASSGNIRAYNSTSYSIIGTIPMNTWTCLTIAYSSDYFDVYNADNRIYSGLPVNEGYSETFRFVGKEYSGLALDSIDSNAWDSSYYLHRNQEINTSLSAINPQYNYEELNTEYYREHHEMDKSDFTSHVETAGTITQTNDIIDYYDTSATGYLESYYEIQENTNQINISCEMKAYDTNSYLYIRMLDKNHFIVGNVYVRENDGYIYIYNSTGGYETISASYTSDDYAYIQLGYESGSNKYFVKSGMNKWFDSSYTSNEVSTIYVLTNYGYSSYHAYLRNLNISYSYNSTEYNEGLYITPNVASYYNHTNVNSYDSTDYAYFPSTLTGTYSISFYINMVISASTWLPQLHLWDTPTSNYIYFYASNMYFYDGTSSTLLKSGLGNRVWYHFLFEFDTTTDLIDIYIDGVNIGNIMPIGLVQTSFLRFGNNFLSSGTKLYIDAIDYSTETNYFPSRNTLPNATYHETYEISELSISDTLGYNSSCLKIYDRNSNNQFKFYNSYTQENVASNTIYDTIAYISSNHINISIVDGIQMFKWYITDSSIFNKPIYITCGYYDGYHGKLDIWDYETSNLLYSALSEYHSSYPYHSRHLTMNFNSSELTNNYCEIYAIDSNFLMLNNGGYFSDGEDGENALFTQYTINATIISQNYGLGYFDNLYQNPEYYPKYMLTYWDNEVFYNSEFEGQYCANMSIHSSAGLRYSVKQYYTYITDNEVVVMPEFYDYDLQGYMFYCPRDYFQVSFDLDYPSTYAPDELKIIGTPTGFQIIDTLAGFSESYVIPFDYFTLQVQFSSGNLHVWVNEIGFTYSHYAYPNYPEYSDIIHCQIMEMFGNKVGFVGMYNSEDSLPKEMEFGGYQDFREKSHYFTTPTYSGYEVYFEQVSAINLTITNTSQTSENIDYFNLTLKPYTRYNESYYLTHDSQYFINSTDFMPSSVSEDFWLHYNISLTSFNNLYEESCNYTFSFIISWNVLITEEEQPFITMIIGLFIPIGLFIIFPYIFKGYGKKGSGIGVMIGCVLSFIILGYIGYLDLVSGLLLALITSFGLYIIYKKENHRSEI